MLLFVLVFVLVLGVGSIVPHINPTRERMVLGPSPDGKHQVEYWVHHRWGPDVPVDVAISGGLWPKIITRRDDSSNTPAATFVAWTPDSDRVAIVISDPLWGGNNPLLIAWDLRAGHEISFESVRPMVESQIRQRFRREMSSDGDKDPIGWVVEQKVKPWQ